MVYEFYAKARAHPVGDEKTIDVSMRAIVDAITRKDIVDALHIEDNGEKVENLDFSANNQCYWKKFTTIETFPEGRLFPSSWNRHCMKNDLFIEYMYLYEILEKGMICRIGGHNKGTRMMWDKMIETDRVLR